MIVILEEYLWDGIVKMEKVKNFKGIMDVLVLYFVISFVVVDKKSVLVLMEWNNLFVCVVGFMIEVVFIGLM